MYCSSVLEHPYVPRCIVYTYILEYFSIPSMYTKISTRVYEYFSTGSSYARVRGNEKP